MLPDQLSVLCGRTDRSVRAQEGLRILSLAVDSDIKDMFLSLSSKQRMVQHLP